ncbi:hypothetical protein [Azospirillum thiophilum]|nr:hypothetical protein [Azospirillum thiophilum]
MERAAREFEDALPALPAETPEKMQVEILRNSKLFYCCDFAVMLK